MVPILSKIRHFFGFPKPPVAFSREGGLSSAKQVLEELIDLNKVPGLAITILKKGETVFEKGFGYADIKQKVRVDPKKTLFRIASASKPIAAMALAKLVSQNRIDLDQSFYTYVPYFPKKKFDFTIRQLASHTAGIRAYRGKEYALNKPYSIKESIAIFQDDPLEFEPGTDYLYTSFDWVLISLAIEEITRMPFAAYVKKEVLQPLKMDSTYEEYPDVRRTSRAEFYTKTKTGFRKAVAVDNQYKLAGGGYLSTSNDLAKLGMAVLENKLLPGEIMKEFLTAQRVKGTSTYYGLGWQVSRDTQGRSFVGHLGNGIGGYSNFYVYPKEEVVLVILINCTDPKIQDYLDKMVIPLLVKESPNPDLLV